MRAVMDVSDELLAERHRQGHDRWDEVWEGVLHMVPPPHGDHGRLNDGLAVFFRLHWEERGCGRTFSETGVRRPEAPWIKISGERIPSDYKIPDRCFLLPEHDSRLKGGWIVGAPDVVLEIVSPGDESYEKLPFYFAIGVRETIYIHRESRAVEVRRRGKGDWTRVAADSRGWHFCKTLDTELKRERDGRLRIRRRSDPERETLIGR